MNDERDKPRYRVGVQRSFSARHYLTVPDAGPEADVHAHRYRVELVCSGPSLDDVGYLVNIDTIEDVLDEIEARYAGTLLNELPEFGGSNPSVERLAHAVSDLVTPRLDEEALTGLTVRIWEAEEAWASVHRSLVQD